jgi:hypothetical protein
MPITTRQYSAIKQNLKLWHLVEEQGVDHAALWDMFIECRNALQLIVDAQEEGNPPSFFDRLRGFFGR